MMIEKANKTAEKYDMIKKGDSLLCGFSGGADSVALMLFLLARKEEMGLIVFAAHLNHGIRGAEADRDEAFCRDFCRKHSIPLFVKRVDIPALCIKTRESLELTARKVRYAYFDELCRENGIKKIALAHNSDDHAETILLNLTRGSGITGLCGIPPIRDNIIRPLIEISKEEIESFLADQKQDFVLDSTNLSDEYTRNKIRHNILPQLKEINPSVLSALNRQGELLREDREFLDTAADILYQKAHIDENGAEMDISDLSAAHRATSSRVIYRICREVSGVVPQKKHIEQILTLCERNRTSRELSLDGLTITSMYGKLFFSKEKDEIPSLDYRYALTGDTGTIKIEGTPFTVFYQMKKNEDKILKIQRNLKYVLINYDKIYDNVIIRTRKTKDSYVPLGFSGHRTVKKMMIDEKIPRNLRDILPVFVCGSQIIWVYGLRPCADFVPDEKTKTLLQLEVFKE